VRSANEAVAIYRALALGVVLRVAPAIRIKIVQDFLESLSHAHCNFLMRIAMMCGLEIAYDLLFSWPGMICAVAALC